MNLEASSFVIVCVYVVFAPSVATPPWYPSATYCIVTKPVCGTDEGLAYKALTSAALNDRLQMPASSIFVPANKEDGLAAPVEEPLTTARSAAK